MNAAHPPTLGAVLLFVLGLLLVGGVAALASFPTTRKAGHTLGGLLVLAVVAFVAFRVNDHGARGAWPLSLTHDVGEPLLGRVLGGGPAWSKLALVVAAVVLLAAVVRGGRRRQPHPGAARGLPAVAAVLGVIAIGVLVFMTYARARFESRVTIQARQPATVPADQIEAAAQARVPQVVPESPPPLLPEVPAAPPGAPKPQSEKPAESPPSAAVPAPPAAVKTTEPTAPPTPSEPKPAEPNKPPSGPKPAESVKPAIDNPSADKPPAAQLPAEKPPTESAPANSKAAPIDPASIKPPAARRPNLPAEAESSPRPAWVDEKPKREGNVYRIAVASGRFSTQEECLHALDRAIKREADAYVDRLRGDGAAGMARLPLDFLKSRALKENELYWEVTMSSVGLMCQVHGRLEFDNQARAWIDERIHDDLVSQRLAGVGLATGTVLGLLGTIFGFLKVDLATRGAYRLQLAAVGAILLIVGVVVALV